MAAKLLPCPFCGGSADEEVIIDGSDLSKVYCTNPDCGAEISYEKNLLRVRKLWNRRQKIVEGVRERAPNNRYMTALDVLKSFLSVNANKRVFITDFRFWCNERLNAAKAPHCT